MLPLISREAPGARAPAERRLGGRLAHALVGRQAEVIVGAEQQHLAPGEQDARALRPLDQPQPPVEAALAQLLEPGRDVRHRRAT